MVQKEPDVLAKVPYLRVDAKTGVLRYRRVFPPELRQYLVDNYRGLSELKVSLKARTLHEPGAMEIYQDTGKLYDRLVARARKAAEGRYDELTDERIAFLAEAYRFIELADDETARFDPTVKANGLMVAKVMEDAGFEIPPHRPTARWSQGFRIAHGWSLEVYRDLSADGNLEGIVEAWGERAVALASRLGLCLDESTPAFRRLCIRFNEAAIAAHTAQLQRLDGEISAYDKRPDRTGQRDRHPVTDSGEP